MKFFLFTNLVALSLMLPFSSLASARLDAPILEFHPVVSGVTRGARPTIEGLRFLAKSGVKTILNLEDDPKAVAWEKAEATKLGMKVISTPMSGFFRPKTKQVNQSLQVMADSRYYPLFVHCQHGQDRTGVISGLYRVIYQRWAPADAYQEMLANHFHPILFMLQQYFFDVTGYNPHPHSSDPNAGGGG